MGVQKNHLGWFFEHPQRMLEILFSIMHPLSIKEGLGGVK